MKSLQTVILAGGLATRLKPVTTTIPKAMLPIHGEPFINHQLRLLYRQGIREIVLCIGYLGDMIIDHLGDGQRFGMRIQYVVDGEKLLGTGGAIKNALPLLDDVFFVLYGDSYLTCDYQSVQTVFERSNKQGLMTVLFNKNQWDLSNIEYAQGMLIAYDKINQTERMHHIDYGLGILAKSALQAIPDGVPYDLAALYQSLLHQNQLAAFEVHQRFYEVGSFNGIHDFETYLHEAL